MPANATHPHSATMRHPGCIMILGATNDDQGNLSLMAKLRLKQGALEYERHHAAGYKILLTGGFGSHFNTTGQPHWRYSKSFLENEIALPPDAFLPETVESANTVEDFEKGAPIFRHYNFAHTILVTSAFHMPRALYIAKHALPISENSIVAVPAPDAELGAEFLAKARAHELRALEYLRANYPPPRRTHAQP